jgi:HPt (histidine-containing phosphotransfer) domain-containing protein
LPALNADCNPEVPMSETPEHQQQPIRSQFADDPDMADLVELFVSEMPSRIESLRNAWEEGQIGLLTRIAHQLSGACGGYGFPTVGSAARELERRLNRLDEEAAEQRLREMTREYESLVELCSRTCGLPSKP